MIAAFMVYFILAGALFAVAAACVERLAAGWRMPRRFVWLAAMTAAVAVPAAMLWIGTNSSLVSADTEIAGVQSEQTVSQAHSDMALRLSSTAAESDQTAMNTATDPLRALSLNPIPPQAPAATELDRSADLQTTQPRWWKSLETRFAELRDASMQRAALLADSLRHIRAQAEPIVQRLNPWLLGLWIAVTLTLALTFARAWLQLSRLMRHWPAVQTEDGPVRVAERVGPAAFGAFKPTIVVPRWLLSAPAALREPVLRHEREHIASHDPLVLFLAQWLVVLLPWNLPLWWILGRLRFAIEADCDARVLRTQPDPRAYGRALIEISRHRSDTPAIAMAITRAGAQLERRIRIMLTKTRMSTVRSTVLAAFAVLLVGGTTQLQGFMIGTAAAAGQDPADSAQIATPTVPDFEPSPLSPLFPLFPLEGWVAHSGNDLPTRAEFEPFIRSIPGILVWSSPAFPSAAEVACVATYGSIGDRARILHLEDGTRLARFDVHLPDGRQYTLGIHVGHSSPDAFATSYSWAAHISPSWITLNESAPLIIRGTTHRSGPLSAPPFTADSLTEVRMDLLTRFENHPEENSIIEAGIALLWDSNLCSQEGVSNDPAYIPPTASHYPTAFDFTVHAPSPTEATVQIVEGFDALAETLGWQTPAGFEAVFPREDWIVLTGDAIPSYVLERPDSLSSRPAASPVACYAVFPGFEHGAEYVLLENGERFLRMEYSLAGFGFTPESGAPTILQLAARPHFSASSLIISRVFSNGPGFTSYMSTQTDSSANPENFAPLTREAIEQLPFVRQQRAAYENRNFELVWSDEGLEEIRYPLDEFVPPPVTPQTRHLYSERDLSPPRFTPQSRLYQPLILADAVIFFASIDWCH